jgi:hypothetical protein
MFKLHEYLGQGELAAKLGKDYHFGLQSATHIITNPRHDSGAGPRKRPQRVDIVGV